MIDIYPTYRNDSEGSSFFSHLNSILGHPGIPFLTCRSAMLSGITASGLNRMDEILVPPYLGHCVLSAISRTCFPTMTPSDRTKAILVFHQYGFPQKLDVIESMACDRKWIILNDCANTLFTKVEGRYLIDWGDLSVASLSKLYPCGLGGGLWTRSKEMHSLLAQRNETDSALAKKALNFYLDIHGDCSGIKTQIKIDMLFGYLPTIKSMPSKAFQGLPGSLEEITSDITRRKKIYEAACHYLNDRVPLCEEAVVPFAIPISGENEALLGLSQKIKERFKANAPVLHFDFAMNMLAPDYRPALVVGCNRGWTEEITEGIFRLAEKEL